MSATDYLLKPLNRARLADALERVRKVTGPRPRDRAMDRVARADGLSPTRFLARRGARFKVVPKQDVVAFTFDDGVTRLHTLTEPLSMQPTLTALARRLDAAAFFQISRTTIVQLDAVREAKPCPDGTGEIVLANGQTFVVARRRWRALIERLGN